MSFAGLLHGLQDVLVDAEREGAQQRQEEGVGDDRDDREPRERKQDHQAGAEDGSSAHRVTPVQQVRGYVKRKTIKDKLI